MSMPSIKKLIISVVHLAIPKKKSKACNAWDVDPTLFGKTG